MTKIQIDINPEVKLPRWGHHNDQHVSIDGHYYAVADCIAMAEESQIVDEADFEE